MPLSSWKAVFLQEVSALSDADLVNQLVSEAVTSEMDSVSAWKTEQLSQEVISRLSRTPSADPYEALCQATDEIARRNA